MTRTTRLTALAFLGSATAALALTDIDTDGDAALSIEEFLSAYPSLTATEFETVDRNADGMIDADEHAEAVTIGVLPSEPG